MWFRSTFHTCTIQRWSDLRSGPLSVVTGIRWRENIFEGISQARITPRNRTPTRAAGCWTLSGSSVTSDSLIKLFHYVSVSPTRVVVVMIGSAIALAFPPYTMLFPLLCPALVPVLFRHLCSQIRTVQTGTWSKPPYITCTLTPTYIYVLH